jgi:predicted metal-dependent enzyme (double-stranded beta helix superfamily)
MKLKVGYGRQVLYKDKDVEVVLVEWPPQSCSRAHAHGVSSGLIRVLSGQIFQDVYKLKNKKFVKRLSYKKNETMVETPDLIHIMGNNSRTKSAQTLHIYTPPLQMQYYDELGN